MEDMIQSHIQKLNQMVILRGKLQPFRLFFTQMTTRTATKGSFYKITPNKSLE